MGNIRDLLNKIRYIKEIFIQRWAQKKDRNGMDLTEAVDIKQSWKEYKEELYKKDLHDPDNYDRSPRARHPGIRGQVCLRKHHYEQS